MALHHPPDMITLSLSFPATIQKGKHIKYQTLWHKPPLLQTIRDQYLDTICIRHCIKIGIQSLGRIRSFWGGRLLVHKRVTRTIIIYAKSQVPDGRRSPPDPQWGYDIVSGRNTPPLS